MKEAAEILAEAREYIEENGRTTGTLRDSESGFVCAIGAITWSQGLIELCEEDVCNPQYGLSEAVHILADTIRAYPHTDGFDPDRWGTDDYVIVRFNDRDECTDQMVIDMFARAEKVALAGFDPDAA